MLKTVVVRVDRLRRHPKYLKSYRVSRNYQAHAEDAATYQPGDVVRIQESRPRSRSKRWQVAALVRRASNVIAKGDDAPTPEVARDATP